ncbi:MULTISPECIES: YfiR family protein [Sphingobium]|uniref:Putative transmembrane protein n=1 Tax=Sphingobium indicum (strain DSM 16413 / CCM 7287 / MTCC 6362 / UT26 / NBRC 101211 / UT26S) TaxID=452662 RepID=D4Z7H4_SPHIU|nr:YfiR family protein [Sphingobium indicum]BAI98443.1 putative transmembrane protein [Sphingobium indicum UT26S]
MDDLSPWRGRRGQRRRRAALSCLAAVALLVPAPVPANSPAALERAIQANFLFKFAPFVEWPPAAFSGTERNFVICVVGEDPFGAMLNDVVRGQKMVGRPVVVRRTGGEAGPACHILFAGRSADPGYAPFATTGGQPVLTVADKGAGPSGAMIEFVRRNGRVRFQIDDKAARANGLKISSKLLGLAIAVDRK